MKVLFFLLIPLATFSQVKSFKLDKFSSIPEEYLGVGCTYSISKKDYEQGKYIYVSNLEKGIISIDGVFIEFWEKYSSNGKIVNFLGSKINGHLSRKTVKAYYDGSEQVGTILINFGGKSRTLPFYGRCGD